MSYINRKGFWHAAGWAPPMVSGEIQRLLDGCKTPHISQCWWEVLTETHCHACSSGVSRPGGQLEGKRWGADRAAARWVLPTPTGLLLSMAAQPLPLLAWPLYNACALEKEMGDVQGMKCRLCGVFSLCQYFLVYAIKASGSVSYRLQLSL